MIFRSALEGALAVPGLLVFLWAKYTVETYSFIQVIGRIKET